jgi:predicted lactoylglutathione lyase
MGLSYATLGSNDLVSARAFYAAILSPLAGAIVQEVPEQAFCCLLADGRKLWITRPFNGQPATSGNGAMIAFESATKAGVGEAHAAGLRSGGSSEGAPGPRPLYGPGVYVGYLRDPDGNKLAVVHNETGEADDPASA